MPAAGLTRDRTPRSMDGHKLWKGSGGAEGDRTPGLYSAIVALSQLSYSPIRAEVYFTADLTRWVSSSTSEERRAISSHVTSSFSNSSTKEWFIVHMPDFRPVWSAERSC